MDEPKWLYSWSWTEADEIRLNGAADDLDALANELSSLAASCCTQGKKGLSSDLNTDAGAYFEDELERWRQSVTTDVVNNLRASASAIRNTVATRQTLWDQFQKKLKNFKESLIQ